MIQCIYAVAKTLVFRFDDSEIRDGMDRLGMIIERQMSLFAEEDTLDGLLDYINDPFCDLFWATKMRFRSGEKPLAPFRCWQIEGTRMEGSVDDEFKDLIVQMTNFDPMKRITAAEALDHVWFQGA